MLGTPEKKGPRAAWRRLNPKWKSFSSDGVNVRVQVTTPLWLRTREASVGGRDLDLTAREFDLLAFLMHAPGRVFTREQIYEGVWGYSYLGDSKVIDYFVSSLRRKLGGAPEGSLIRTVRGVGYVIAAEEPA